MPRVTMFSFAMWGPTLGHGQRVMTYILVIVAFIPLSKLVIWVFGPKVGLLGGLGRRVKQSILVILAFIPMVGLRPRVRVASLFKLAVVVFGPMVGIGPRTARRSKLGILVFRPMVVLRQRVNPHVEPMYT